MSPQARDFLAGLYASTGLKPEGGDQAPDVATLPGSPEAATVEEEEDQSTAVDKTDGPPAPDFSDWIRRPDVNGRMGLETPDLPEWQQWWARHDFDELPELLADVTIGGREARAT